MKLELDGTRLVDAWLSVLKVEGWRFTGEAGRVGGRGVYAEVVLLNGGLDCWELGEGGTRFIVRNWQLNFFFSEYDLKTKGRFDPHISRCFVDRGQ